MPLGVKCENCRCVTNEAINIDNAAIRQSNRGLERVAAVISGSENTEHPEDRQSCAAPPGGRP